ncbi:hypothetical protein ABH937_005541 [Kitasatospora sp. GAS1066B]
MSGTQDFLEPVEDGSSDHAAAVVTLDLDLVA